KVEDCYYFEFKNRSWASRNSRVTIRMSEKNSAQYFLRFSFKFQRSFDMKISTEFSDCLEIAN
ncbi:hypothetical protein, partial [Winogradskyella damuponensis]|uniref:hypothetical protein n=1 Tax=Winogradskyella damuponensis TaxID=943939 RepID=UPI0031DE98FA